MPHRSQMLLFCTIIFFVILQIDNRHEFQFCFWKSTFYLFVCTHLVFSMFAGGTYYISTLPQKVSIFIYIRRKFTFSPSLFSISYFFPLVDFVSRVHFLCSCLNGLSLIITIEKIYGNRLDDLFPVLMINDYRASHKMYNTYNDGSPWTWHEPVTVSISQLKWLLQVAQFTSKTPTPRRFHGHQQFSKILPYSYFFFPNFFNSLWPNRVRNYKNY